MNHKEEVIKRYWERGLTIGGIVRKVGYQDMEKGSERVWDGLKRMGLVKSEQMPPWGVTITDRV
jgi:hypothetical protein